jgi:hypothetical protein
MKNNFIKTALTAILALTFVGAFFTQTASSSNTFYGKTVCVITIMHKRVYIL